ncbi:hypothetical protein N9822_00365 [bacterium]|nr:hypothetical protein [bacterium]
MLLDVDSGNSDSITQQLYSYTSLEKQVFGIKYKGEFFEFYGGEDQGGTNDVYWFERGDIDEQQDRIKAANTEIETLTEDLEDALDDLKAEMEKMIAGDDIGDDEGEKSASETTRKYVEKVSATMGDNKTWTHSEAIHERINEIDTW